MEIENFIVSSQVWEKLEKYEPYYLLKVSDFSESLRVMKEIRDDTIKAEFIEDIAELFFKAYDTEYIKLPHRKMQKFNGDFFIMQDIEGKFVECKSSHVFKTIDKVALDYSLHKYNNEPYYPKHEDGQANKGYLHYCKANILFCVNLAHKKIYIILDFQKLKSKILTMIEEGSGELEKYNIEYAYKQDGNKYSKIYMLDFRYLQDLGVDMLEYNIANECDILDLSNKKNTLGDQTLSIS